MVIKLKKLRPVAAFIAFLLAANILVFSGGFCLIMLLNSGMNFPFVYSQYPRYKSAVGGVLEDCYNVALYDFGITIGTDYDQRYVGSRLASESNIVYTIIDENDGSTIATNIPEGKKVVNSEYNHFLLLEGTNLTEWFGEASQSSPSYSGDFGLTSYYGQIPAELRTLLESGAAMDVSILLQVKAPKSMTNYGSIQAAWYDWYAESILLVTNAALAILAAITLAGLLIGRKSLVLAHQTIAKLMGKLWCEVKLFAAVLIGYGCLEMLVFGLGNQSTPDLVFAWGCFWLLWLVATDICINKKRFFTHNSLASLRQFWRGLMSKYAFLARMKRTYTAQMCAQLALLALMVIIPLIFDRGGSWLFCLGLVLLGAYLLVTYMGRYNRNMDDFAKLMDYTEQVKNGTADNPPELSEQSDFAPMCASLREIHGGISAAVERQVRSERMKAELITNVSHDLKTPLTSIINYVDLLGAETLQPDFANDYVKVLAQKSQRLKNLVQDLFDVSKANSGAIDLQVQRLDIVALLEQTTAELEEQVQAAGVELKEQYTKEPLMVLADGKKLHRVFENLLGNALKYALGGTRVYITAQRLGEAVQVVFKNVANYEMSFTPEDMMERFQRGDDSRTTEGSGLGLAIAKSFLELCGGRLKIELDGDLFKAVVTMPYTMADAPEAAPPVQEAPDFGGTLQQELEANAQAVEAYLEGMEAEVFGVEEEAFAEKAAKG